MMLVPRKSSFDLFDDFFDDEFFNNRKGKDLMKTDIIEKKDKYVLNIDLPGYEKDNINISLNNGYLNITAKIESDNDESDSDNRILRRERFYGEASRSFYLGEEIKEEDIEAEFKNGILIIDIPKKELEDKKDTIKQINIK